MALVDDLADRLAADVMTAMDELGDDRFYIEVGKVIGTSSPSLEEAFMTSCRLRISETRARRFIEDRLAALRRDKKSHAG